jgi:hypothetical protein
MSGVDPNDSNSRVIAGINTTNSNILYETNSLKNIQLMKFRANSFIQFRIPFVNNRKDKIFYIIEHNYDDNPVNPSTIMVYVTNMSLKLGNFSTTLKNPFATHSNSKRYQRYYGIRIPKENLPAYDSKNLNYLTIILITSDINFYFTEVGTHDESPF